MQRVFYLPCSVRAMLWVSVQCASLAASAVLIVCCPRSIVHVHSVVRVPPVQWRALCRSRLAPVQCVARVPLPCSVRAVPWIIVCLSYSVRAVCLFRCLCCPPDSPPRLLPAEPSTELPVLQKTIHQRSSGAWKMQSDI